MPDGNVTRVMTQCEELCSIAVMVPIDARYVSVGTGEILAIARGDEHAEPIGENDAPVCLTGVPYAASRTATGMCR